jgi:hypothetical protein
VGQGAGNINVPLARRERAGVRAFWPLATDHQKLTFLHPFSLPTIHLPLLTHSRC